MTAMPDKHLVHDGGAILTTIRRRAIGEVRIRTESICYKGLCTQLRGPRFVGLVCGQPLGPHVL